MTVKVVSKIEVPELVALRQRQILQAAVALYGKQGYHVTTIREVAQRAGVSVGLIYQYVSDKEDVLFLALTAAAVAYWLAVGALLGVYRRLYRMWQSRSDGWRIDGRRMVRKERN